MPVARQRHTKPRRDRARVHLEMKSVKTVTCSNCSTQTMPHVVCPKCGFYKNKEVINTVKKLEKKAKKKK